MKKKAKTHHKIEDTERLFTYQELENFRRDAFGDGYNSGYHKGHEDGRKRKPISVDTSLTSVDGHLGCPKKDPYETKMKTEREEKGHGPPTTIDPTGPDWHKGYDIGYADKEREILSMDRKTFVGTMGSEKCMTNPPTTDSNVPWLGPLDRSPYIQMGVLKRLASFLGSGDSEAVCEQEGAILRSCSEDRSHPGTWILSFMDRNWKKFTVKVAFEVLPE